MPRPRRTHVRTHAVLFVAIAVLAGTGLVLLLPLPETRSISSADGAVRIDGVWSPSAEAPSIARQALEEASAAVVRGPVYALSAPPATDGSPYHLAFTVPAALGSAQPILYRFDGDLGAWRAYPSFREPESWVLTAAVSRLPPALWSVGVAPDVVRPARAGDALSELLATPPPGAVGYEAYDAFANADGDAVLLSDPLDAGGCDGNFRVGSSRTKTSRDFPAASGTYRVIVRWQMDGGCQPGERMESARMRSGVIE